MMNVLLLLIVAIVATLSCIKADSPMLIGAGIADVTGEVTEVSFMGYASLDQHGTGLHFRSRARAYVFVDRISGNRAVYVSMDLCMGFEMLKTFIVEELQREFGDIYTRDNLILSGTHTHSAPGGMAGTILADITIFGFSKHNFDIAVAGVVKAVRQAHNNLKPARIFLNEGELIDANINRSPASYLQNPQEERDKYQYNTDKTMTVLRIQGDDFSEIGAIAFYAVHPVSMNNTNTLSSGDNKGFASLLFEAKKNPGTLPGHGSFVAAFGQANPGDVSPNLNGPHCPDGSPCDFVTSTCKNAQGKNRTQGCIANGPGKDMWESTYIIGQRQFQKASDLYDTANIDVTADGGVDSRHSYVNMQNVTVDAKYTSTGEEGHTCYPAMGYGFAGGTTDGPGAFDFTQGQNTTNPFWNFVSGILSKPTPDQVECQKPKAIILNVGQIKPILGGEWTPWILPLQVVKVGSLWFVAVPGEFTTMSWRRLKATVTEVIQSHGLWTSSSRVLICGLSNSYAHYVATYEEYQLQRYEGGSTIYGPHTLAAYQQEFAKIATDLVTGQPSPVGPSPPDMRNKTISFIPKIKPDTVPPNTVFGQVNIQPRASYKIGEIVTVEFWCASPRNDPLSDATYLQVEYVDSQGVTVVADDSAWETKFHWSRPKKTTQSLCKIEWEIPQGTKAGTYQIRTFGNSGDGKGNNTPFQGVSNTFTVGTLDDIISASDNNNVNVKVNDPAWEGSQTAATY